MKTNLDGLRREIQEHLEAQGFVVFKSYPRSLDLSAEAIYWDSERFPDYREFAAAAHAAGARMMTLYGRVFTPAMVDEALEQLEDSDLDRDERRAMERRLNEFRAYEGFICQIELSFAHGQRTYIFDQPTEWYEEMSMLLDELEENYDDGDGDNPLGGFYSNN